MKRKTKGKAVAAFKPTPTPAPVIDRYREPTRSTSNCANCDEKFKSHTKGYYRHSVGNKLPSCGKVAKDVLTSVTGVSFADHTKPRDIEQQFLCTLRWKLANRVGHYLDSVSDFRAKSSPSSYIGERSVPFCYCHATMTSEMKEGVDDHSYSASYAVDIDVDEASVPSTKRKLEDSDQPSSTQKVYMYKDVC